MNYILEFFKNPTLINFLYTTIILLSVIVINILKYNKSKKELPIIFNAIESIAMKYKSLEYEQYEKQQRQIKERCDHIYNELFLLYCKKLNLEYNSIESKTFKIFILSDVRKMTDELLNDACYNNHFYRKTDNEWIIYVNRKKDLILSKISEKVLLLWDKEILKISYSDMADTCTEGILIIFNQYINELLDSLRDISTYYHKEIVRIQKLLKRYKSIDKSKNNKKNKTNININLLKS